MIPALVSFLIAAHDLEGVPGEFTRGQWYRIQMDGGDVVAIDLLEVEEVPS